MMILTGRSVRCTMSLWNNIPDVSRLRNGCVQGDCQEKGCIIGCVRKHLTEEEWENKEYHLY